MGPAVDTLEQHDVDLRQQLIDRPDDHTSNLSCSSWYSRQRDHGSTGYPGSSGIRRHDSHAGHLGLWAGGVQHLRERANVRGIQADDAGPEWPGSRVVLSFTGICERGRRQEAIQYERDNDWNQATVHETVL